MLNTVGQWHAAFTGCYGQHTAGPHVWVLEDDVGYAGGIRNLVEAYAAESGDLVADGPWAVHRGSGQFYWRRVATAPFLAAISPPARLFCRENAHRLSWRLIAAMDSLAGGGVTGWSEMAIPSLCLSLGFTFSAIRPRHIGSPFSWGGRVSQSEWEEVRTDRAQWGKLFHALKW